MQVSVETLNVLERRVTVRLPAEKMATETRNRLQVLSRKVKVHGFRPGKVPFKVMQQMYGQQAWLDAAGELMEHSLHEALAQENLHPVGRPKIEPKSLQEGQDFEYAATFEVAPYIEPTGFETIQVVRPVAEVTAQDVDNMVESLRWQHAIWNPTERPVAHNDRVHIDFEGKVDGQEFPGNKGENAEFVLDGKSLLKGFEEQLLGLATGADTEFDLSLPEDHPNKELAGKTARFQVKLRLIEEATLPELDDAFAKKFDIHQGGMAALRESLLENMQRNLRESIKSIVKRQVMQGLLQANPFPVPQALVEAEIDNLASQMQFPMDVPGQHSQELKAKLFAPQAQQRVALGLLMSELITRQHIEIDEQRVRDILETLASAYQDPTEFTRSFEQDPELKGRVRALALEEQVVDWLLDRAQITDENSSFYEVMDPRRPVVPGSQGLFESSQNPAAQPGAEPTADD